MWIIYSFLTAGFESLKDVVGKKSMESCSPYTAAWAIRIFAFPFIAVLLFFAPPVMLGDSFWWALGVGGSLNLVTAVLYMKAIHASDLSVTVPMVTFSPLFLLVTSPLILGEFPSTRGVFGVVLIVAGSYLLQLKERKKGIFAPFKALVNEKGPRLMLIVAFIWSITANIDKVGIINSSIVHWAVAVHVFTIIAMFPLVWFMSRESFGQLRSEWKILTSLGFVNALKYISQMAAIQLALVAYVVSIKRTSAIISVVLGALIFKEKGLKERLTGSAIMVLGVLLITL
jgi:uncharacterized membrane protein